MKKFGFLFLLLTTSAFAEVPEIHASKVTCQELKDAVEKYGTVIVKKKILLFTSAKYVHHKAECFNDQYTKNFSYKTKDQKVCVVGEYCKDIYVYTDYGSSTDYSSTTTYDWPSHRDTDHDRGPRYDPPSRDYEGPRYDPPSRDDNERGPRYCPTC